MNRRVRAHQEELCPDLCRRSACHPFWLRELHPVRGYLEDVVIRPCGGRERLGNSVLRWFQVSQERVGYVVIAHGGKVRTVAGFTLARGAGLRRRFVQEFLVFR